MKTLRATAENILAASRLIRGGGLVVYPTDTVYGLGCDPFNVEAVKRVFRAKGEREKPLPVLASDMEHAEKIAQLSEGARRVAARLWPGSLTLVLFRKPVLPGLVTRNLDSVGVRIPRHDVALQLIRLSGGLLIGTSANRAGEKSPRTAREAAEQIGRAVDAVLDGGSAPIGVASTVVDLTSKKLRILREGPVSLEDVLEAQRT